MKLYKAKTNFKSNFIIQLSAMMIFSVAIIIIQDFPWFLILIVPIFMAPLLWGLSQIHKNVTYIISGENLFVSAAFINRIIDVKTIRKIEKSNNFIATGTDRATAPSSKALEILYNKYETIKVSPENESDFIKDLLEINPNIKVII
ncbi:hypothetical protein CAPN001_06080 [Capnocytophaga stomatis]|uniref:Uncharacterized protein YyaB-like PH domain-containing protein n=1 Tax=Capnocytophaga stomatis TaxID=1848904 RepID=A0A250FTR2_9FLAO|nr:PH domain-containing protein [Capnocytophaga stomatis]ATA88542.1 hypothetical protein CGC58_01585 [Capnocytophaga stomatis]GIJ93258.1 hypothetical protein CAPN002_04760 [Capnocytophaga stomatis]GIJ96039.1 hypothetical protein CAPN001_06080 [Capnocytophaga stomatis]GIM50309.1 hypothetical protein CAPN003_17610 [Capnocytophaga stomatis]